MNMELDSLINRKDIKVDVVVETYTAILLLLTPAAREHIMKWDLTVRQGNKNVTIDNGTYTELQKILNTQKFPEKILEIKTLLDALVKSEPGFTGLGPCLKRLLEVAASDFSKNCNFHVCDNGNEDIINQADIIVFSAMHTNFIRQASLASEDRKPVFLCLSGTNPDRTGMIDCDILHLNSLHKGEDWSFSCRKGGNCPYYQNKSEQIKEHAGNIAYTTGSFFSYENGTKAFIPVCRAAEGMNIIRYICKGLRPLLIKQSQKSKRFTKKATENSNALQSMLS